VAGVEPLVLAGEVETPATLTAMDKYDRSVGIGLLITVDTTGPVDVASVAACTPAEQADFPGGGRASPGLLIRSAR
jgi:hypothetical protein